ncbi:hypothetical protein ACFPIF_15495 [Brevundimonas faecalis]|uniref:hypothetical protein n=1 Tax=Brevundimonas faecalis TaxID=947378 RepID=UPI0036171E51
MATGANIQQGRGIQVSNIAPQVDLRNGEAEAWSNAERTFDRFNEAAKPNLIARAQERGMTEGVAIAEGRDEYNRSRFLFGDVAEARQRALETAYDARVRQDIDARLGELRREFRYDPETYEARSREVVSGFIQGAPPEFAVAVESYAQTKARDGLAWVADQRSIRDEQETVQALGVRIGTLDERIIALASQPGGTERPEYAEALQERTALQDQRAANPAILYSEDQRLLDDDKLDNAVLGASVSRTAIEAYTAAGKGQGGYAAGMRLLNEEVLNGEAFADMKPEARQRVYRDAAAQLRDFAAVDREERKVEEEREREARTARREAVGDYRLRILLGEATEADVMADTTLTDTDKAGLVSSARAQVRRERADARSVAALEAANARGIYAEFRDQANAGSLSQAEIADGLNSGQITQGQAATLRDLNDRQLKPVIDNVLAPVRDAARAPGRSSRGNAAQMVVAERAATLFVRENPNATLEQQLAGGRAIAERVFGGSAQGRPQTQQNVDSAKTAALSALSAERTRRQQAGRPMSSAEYNRRRNEIMHGS